MNPVAGSNILQIVFAEFMIWFQTFNILCTGIFKWYLVLTVLLSNLLVKVFCHFQNELQ